MELQIRGLNINPTDALSLYIHRRMNAALDRMSHEIRDATLRLKDINGPRGGINKSVRVMLRLTSGERIVLEHTDEDIYRAVDGVAARTKHTVGRRLDRRRDRRRRAC